MGAWGEGPFDNDTAADMIAALTTPLEKIINAKTDRHARQYYEKARVGIQLLLISHGTDILGGPSLEPALKVLIRMRKDTEWLSRWKSPTKIARTIESEILAVLVRIRSCKICRRKCAAQLQAFDVGLKEAIPLPEKSSTRSKPKRTSKVRTRLEPKRKGNRR